MMRNADSGNVAPSLTCNTLERHSIKVKRRAPKAEARVLTRGGLNGKMREHIEAPRTGNRPRKETNGFFLKERTDTQRYFRSTADGKGETE